MIEHLKKQVENANSKDEAKELIKSAGMILNDDEMNMVAGGVMNGPQSETDGPASTQGSGMRINSWDAEPSLGQ